MGSSPWPLSSPLRSVCHLPRDHRPVWGLALASAELVISGLALEPCKEECPGACGRGGLPPRFSVWAAALPEVLSASSRVERRRHLEGDSCLVSTDWQGRLHLRVSGGWTWRARGLLFP